MESDAPSSPCLVLGARLRYRHLTKLGDDRASPSMSLRRRANRLLKNRATVPDIPEGWPAISRGSSEATTPGDERKHSRPRRGRSIVLRPFQGRALSLRDRG